GAVDDGESTDRAGGAERAVAELGLAALGACVATVEVEGAAAGALLRSQVGLAVAEHQVVHQRYLLAHPLSFLRITGEFPVHGVYARATWRGRSKPRANSSSSIADVVSSTL